MLSVHFKPDPYLDGIWVACRIPSVRSRILETRTCKLVFSRNLHQPTWYLYLYTSGFSSRLRCTTQFKRPFLEESFIIHSRLGLVCSLAPSYLLCELPPLMPPLFVLGTVVQVFSSLHGLCSMLPWHSMVAAPCHVSLPSCSASSDSVIILCGAGGALTSGAGLCRRLVDS